MDQPRQICDGHHSSINVSPRDNARRTSPSGCIKKVGELPFWSKNPRLLAGKMLGEPLRGRLYSLLMIGAPGARKRSPRSRVTILPRAPGRRPIMAFKHRLKRRIRHWSQSARLPPGKGKVDVHNANRHPPTGHRTRHLRHRHQSRPCEYAGSWSSGSSGHHQNSLLFKRKPVFFCSCSFRRPACVS